MLDYGPSRNSNVGARRVADRAPGVHQPPQPQPPRAPQPAVAQAAPESVYHEPVQRHVAPRAKAPNKEPSRMKYWLMLAGGLILAVLVGWFAWANQGQAASTAIDSSKYQAVFFANGQIYFGKLELIDDDNLRLKNVFYIQSKTNETTTDTKQTAETGNMQLIKLGEEVHGPEDEMIINRDQVLFFENLKSGGRVAQLINEYKPSTK